MISTAFCGLAIGCQQAGPQTEEAPSTTDEFAWQTEQFADIRILRYQVPGFENLTLQQKELVYYLTQAGLAGRDIIYDQNYRHNLKIRRALETIISNYTGIKDDQFKAVETYAKRVWFSNGIHHHYSNLKFKPEFTEEYFTGLMLATGASLPYEALQAMFNPNVDAKKVDKAEGVDLIEASAVNFYGPNLTQAEVEAFYAAQTSKDDPRPISHGLNSQLVKNENGQIEERVWKVDGMYGKAIAQVIYWLGKA